MNVNKQHKSSGLNFNSHIELYIMGFIFMVIFLLPVLFTRVHGEISWIHVFKIWKDHSLLVPIFAINHWLLIPKQLHKKKYFFYFLSILVLIALCTSYYYVLDEVINVKPLKPVMADASRPTPVPPYAELLIYSLLIVGVDTGLMFSKKWYETEEKKHLLEKRNSDMQLEILRNQVSPHFFMNTLNNIYALIGHDTPKAREAVMKLSKLMRYMLYESENGKVKLSREFEFIQSYIDLMKLRFANENVISLEIPEEYNDVQIPALLFISYIENAFKYGASYENESRIRIAFEIVGDKLEFCCENLKHIQFLKSSKGGLGMENSKNRLDLLFGDKYTLEVNSTEKDFQIKLRIPLA